ncbi:hypothetical protein DJ70_12720 [Halorubrum halodurans]|uniref:Uncharacterized protein n=2 Tax=Halorubrum halodurans TaxID=1383851 RepID=A0A256IEP3_9EURY|nr:hypothetical protein DJ70_12720 [Halorubrum halodurans]
MTNLYDFQKIEPLKIKEKAPIIVRGHTLGWAGPSNRESNVAVTRRHRHPYSGGKQDYFRKFRGYCYGENALDVMERMGVQRIAIEEVDNGRVLEVDLVQYRQSELYAETFEIGGRNVCVPIEEMIHSWDIEDCTIIDKDGNRR